MLCSAMLHSIIFFRTAVSIYRRRATDCKSENFTKITKAVEAAFYCYVGYGKRAVLKKELSLFYAVIIYEIRKITVKVLFKKSAKI